MSRNVLAVSVAERREGDSFKKITHEGVIWRSVDKIVSYEIDSDMMEIEDSFSFQVPFTTEMFKLMVPDSAVRIIVDGTVVLTGFIDKVGRSSSKDSGSMLKVSGRDKGGRLVDESMPLGRLDGIGIKQLGEKAVGQWFGKVSLSNARNRRLLRGKGRRSARVSREPAIEKDRKADRKVNPGDSRSQVLEGFLKKAHLLAWSTADGEELVIGRPNYDQDAQFHAVIPKAGTEVHQHQFVLDFSYAETVADMYSQIVVVGESRGTGVNYHSNVTRKLGRALQGPNPDGTGAQFVFPKVLVIQDSDVRSAKEAQERADREMTERLSTNLTLDVVMPGHAQSGVVFHFDSVMLVDDREGIGAASYYITKVHFSGSKGGQTTSLSLVPEGTVLQLGGF